MNTIAGAADPCEGVHADSKRTPGPGATQASASGVSASSAKKPTCLCVKEGHAGLQPVGTFRNGVFVRSGLAPCAICDGTGISPRARWEGATEPSEPLVVDELEALLEEGS